MKLFLVVLSLVVAPILSIETLTDDQLQRYKDLFNTDATDKAWVQGDGIRMLLEIVKTNYDNIHSLYKLADSNNNLTTTISETIEKNCGASGNSMHFIEKILFPIVQRLFDEVKDCKKVVLPPQSPHHQYPQQPNRNYYPTANGVTVDFVDAALYQELAKANQKTQGQTPNSFYVRK